MLIDTLSLNKRKKVNELINNYSVVILVNTVRTNIYDYIRLERLCFDD